MLISIIDRQRFATADAQIALCLHQASKAQAIPSSWPLASLAQLFSIEQFVGYSILRPFSDNFPCERGLGQSLFTGSDLLGKLSLGNLWKEILTGRTALPGKVFLCEQYLFHVSDHIEVLK